MMYRLYSISTACGTPIISNADIPIAWLYFWFGRYNKYKTSSNFILGKYKRRLSIAFM